MTYDLRPTIKVQEHAATAVGITEIVASLKEQITKKNAQIICFETYPGIDQQLLNQLVAELVPEKVIHSEICTRPKKEINCELAKELTEDRVFGLMTHAEMNDYFDCSAITEVQQEIKATNGLVIVWGVGAALIASSPDITVYFDITRWEIQKRFRKGLNNWLAEPETDALKKFKRGYFFEWRIADKLKSQLRSQTDFYIDGTKNEKWTMIDRATYETIQKKAVQRPFRLVPYFDQSPWGGQWMKEKFELPDEIPNYGWAFDGVPEENSLIFELENAQYEMPAINLVRNYPSQLLGERVYALFGTEFPIRFDYLDTMGGGNLSLQVHPKVEYIQEKFGMVYTQNESYYILDAKEDASIYLGLKNNTDIDELFNELEKASKDSNYRFDDTKYINHFPVQKHDHFSIPAGTIHCGGTNAVVLEISATPYIFTFKLWDWGRLGLDGKPRPIHLEHGRKNVDRRFDEDYVRANLFSPNEILSSNEQALVEKTGLCDLEFIETRRHTFTGEIKLEAHDSVNMLCLVEGESIELFSDDGEFVPITIHYGETFIIPDNCQNVSFKNNGKNPSVVIQAFIK